MKYDYTDAIRKEDYKVDLCNFSDIRHIFEGYHYKKGAIGGGISFCFALIFEGEIVGGAVTGLPRHSKKYNDYIDIRRMACLDKSPKNSESFFMGKIIRYVASNTHFTGVLSYSDKSVGHFGTIYKASNFLNSGLTSKSKHVVYGEKEYHMRSLTIDRPYSYKLREAVKDGTAHIVTGDSKIIWLYKITRKQKNKIFNLDNLHDNIKYGKKIKQPNLFHIG